MAFPSVGFIHAARRREGRKKEGREEEEQTRRDIREKRHFLPITLNLGGGGGGGGISGGSRTDRRTDSAALHERARQEAVHLLLSIAGRSAHRVTAKHRQDRSNLRLP